MINLRLHLTVAYIDSKFYFYEHKPWESSQLEYDIIKYLTTVKFGIS